LGQRQQTQPPPHLSAMAANNSVALVIAIVAALGDHFFFGVLSFARGELQDEMTETRDWHIS